MFDDVKSVMLRVTRLGALLVAIIAAVGSMVGFFVAGSSGVFAAWAGSLAAFAFTGLTVLSVLFGSKLKIGGLLGMVLGGWLIKMVLFLAFFSYLNQADWLISQARPVVFFTVVAAVVAGLVLDTWVVNKARLSPEVKLP
ncbi:MAG: hypothetical protein KGQ56_05060 [Acidobacteria bacterium]|nr:hypothetical protein [Acidobacteriota bacterium]